GRTKRTAWDLKGRLVDMEAAFQEVFAEKERNKFQFLEYNSQIKVLEQEKLTFHQNLLDTQAVVNEKDDEIKRLKQTLRKNEEDAREMCEDLSRKVKQGQNTIEELEFQNSGLDRRGKSLDSDLNMRIEEISQLKATLSLVTSNHAGMEVVLSSTKQVLSDRIDQVASLEDQVQRLQHEIAHLDGKLTQGESLRRKLHNQLQELKGNIRVYCRLRPLLPNEIERNDYSAIIQHINILDERSLELTKGDPTESSMSGLTNRGENKFEFTYDRVFGQDDSQETVFTEICQLVQSALDGYNVCVFAYGQTGSGKTYTMEGGCDDWPEDDGMIPRTVKHIFSSIEMLKDKGWEYEVKANFLEIYNETIRDLLSTRENKHVEHEIRRIDKTSEDIVVSNLTVVDVKDEYRVHQLLRTAKQARAVAATSINERSSRSHCVFQIKLTGYNVKTSESCEGTLSLVDLAGSERLKESGSEGKRLTETQNINKSLSNLTHVIMALGHKASHIPYRNSKLTHLLMNSLGGNSKTLMFVNISPLESCYHETLNSLRFAMKVNQCHIGTASKQIK
ncbi:unnamed protein product, partial [Meganyctiphanes norvegica]